MRATETIYREMLTAYAKRRGGQLQEDCDLSVRLWAAAAQIQALEAQAEWVLGQSFPQTAAGVYLDRHGAMRGIVRQAPGRATGQLTFRLSNAQTGAVSWAGPLLCADFGAKDGVDEICQAFFEDLLCGQGEGAGWRLPKERGAATAQPEGVDIPGAAILWGSNLAVLVSLLGTPYFPQIDGGILFLEDVGEHPYRIERMLTQLLHAGVLARQKAIVLGQFTDYSLSRHDAGFKLQTVVDRLRGQVACPVLTGLPFGHVPTKVLLPVGATVSLSVQGREALLYWGHV